MSRIRHCWLGTHHIESVFYATTFAHAFISGVSFCSRWHADWRISWYTVHVGFPGIRIFLQVTWAWFGSSRPRKFRNHIFIKKLCCHCYHSQNCNVVNTWDLKTLGSRVWNRLTHFCHQDNNNLIRCCVIQNQVDHHACHQPAGQRTVPYSVLVTFTE